MKRGRARGLCRLLVRTAHKVLIDRPHSTRRQVSLFAVEKNLSFFLIVVSAIQQFLIALCRVK